MPPNHHSHERQDGCAASCLNGLGFNENGIHPCLPCHGEMNGGESRKSEQLQWQPLQVRGWDRELWRLLGQAHADNAAEIIRSAFSQSL